MGLFLRIGLILSLSIPLGHLSVRFKLPKILGYLAGGIILGPSLLNFLNKPFLDGLSLFKEFALYYILFLVGTRLKGEALRGSLKVVLNAFLFQFFLTFFLVWIASVFLFKSLFLAILVGLIAATIAPASTIAVIDELKAEGGFTSSFLLLLVMNDLIVIYLFSLLFPLASGKTALSFYHLYNASFKFLSSALIGLIGGIVLTYLEIRSESSFTLTLISIGLLFFLFGSLEYLNISPYISALVFGFFVSNASIKHKRVLKELDFFDEIIYILFFFIAGASMHLKLLYWMAPWVLLYVVLRGFGMFFGAYRGAKRGGADEREAKSLGMCVLTQAGIAIGFAFLLGEQGGAGKLAMNIILGSTVIFEIGGIILLRKGLIRVGEVKLFRILEYQAEPIFDLHLEDILRQFLKQFGIYRMFRTKEKEIKAEHLMIRNFRFLKHNDHLSKILEVVEEARCLTIPVLNKNNLYQGVIKIEDLEEFYTDETMDRLILAEDVMRTDAPYISPDVNIKQAFESFRTTDYDALPVCNKEGKVIGVVLRRELLRHL